MKEARRTKQQLLDELTELHCRMDELAAEVACLAENEERHRCFVNNIEDGCFETNLGGDVTFSNEACSKI